MTLNFSGTAASRPQTAQQKASKTTEFVKALRLQSYLLFKESQKIQ